MSNIKQEDNVKTNEEGGQEMRILCGTGIQHNKPTVRNGWFCHLPVSSHSSCKNNAIEGNYMLGELLIWENIIWTFMVLI